jgi:Na+/H+ antiporter NhaC
MWSLITTYSGALLGGSMFGDNLSMISDTTIAAQSLGCDLKDKFKINLLLHFPAVITVILFFTSV